MPLDVCPFCQVPGCLVKERLWNGSHGYPGHYDYSIRCLNESCLIQPRTRDHDDIYRSEAEAIEAATIEWNLREDPPKSEEVWTMPDGTPVWKEILTLKKIILEKTALAQYWRDKYETLKEINRHGYF